MNNITQKDLLALATQVRDRYQEAQDELTSTIAKALPAGTRVMFQAGRMKAPKEGVVLSSGFYTVPDINVRSVATSGHHNLSLRDIKEVLEVPTRLVVVARKEHSITRYRLTGHTEYGYWTSKEEAEKKLAKYGLPIVFERGEDLR